MAKSLNDHARRALHFNTADRAKPLDCPKSGQIQPDCGTAAVAQAIVRGGRSSSGGSPAVKIAEDSATGRGLMTAGTGILVTKGSATAGPAIAAHICTQDFAGLLPQSAGIAASASDVTARPAAIGQGELAHAPIGMAAITTAASQAKINRVTF